MLNKNNEIVKLNDDYVWILNLEKPNWLAVIKENLLKILENNESKDLNIDEYIKLLAKYNIIDEEWFINNSEEIKNENNKKKWMSAWVHLTNQCNLDCSYCYIWKDNSKMTEENMNKIISSITNTVNEEKLERLHLSFAWGEPLLNFKWLKYFIENLNSNLEFKPSYSITTNATLLSDSNLPFLKENKFRLYVSLDWLEKHNDNQRFYKNWKWSFQNIIKWLEKAIDYLWNKITVWIVVTPFNLWWLKDLTKFLLEKNIQFKYSFYRPNEKNAYKDLNFKLFLDDLERVLLECFDYIEKNSYNWFNPEIIFDKFSIRWKWTEKVCSMWENYFAISHKWEIAPCHMIQEEKLFNIENNTNLLRKLEETWKDFNYDIEDLHCDTCNIKNICRTWCRLVIDPNLKTSIYHKVYINLYKRYLEMIWNSKINLTKNNIK